MLTRVSSGVVKRDPRLQGLSSEHHQALVLARTLETGRAVPDLAARFAAELEPHFRIEEEMLLPALAAAGEETLVRRTLDDHAALRALVADPASGVAFGRRLREHVRFEERELFPACEAHLGDEVLEAVAARSPRPRG